MKNVDPSALALVFDCDGTIADTMPLHNQCWKETLESLGHPYPADFFDARMGMSSHAILRDVNEAFGYGIDVDATSAAKKKRVMELLPQAGPVEPVVAIIREARGVLPMSVVSGGARDCVMLVLETLGLADLFVTIITADDPIPPKPAPDKFLTAARRMGIEPRFCQVYEDGDAGLKAARAAGMIATDVRSWY